MGVTAAMRSAGKAVLRAVGTPAYEAEQDLLDTLKAEHDEVKDLLEDLDAADTSAQRKALVRKIKAALLPHSKAEEKVLYAALIKLRDKNAQTDGLEGGLEHDLAARTLQKLAAITNATSPAHRATAKVLKELVEHHIREEERNVWSDAKEHFSEEERLMMNRRYLAMKAQIRIG